MNFLKFLTLGSSTTATPGARDATPAGTASLRDAVLTLLVTAICTYAATQGVPVPPEEVRTLIAELAGGAATVFGVVQYVRRLAANRVAQAPAAR